MFESEVALLTATPGVATGLAYTPFGGDILFVEATRMPGKGRLKLTGQIGEVMRESAQAAYSLLKSNAQKLHLDAVSFSQTDVHIHVPAGAVPKDGPSAGVAMYTALASLFLNRPVRPDLAMTGEITLRGLVLPIGGVKEKVIAAQRAGIRRVILPQRNRKHIDEVSAQVRKDVSFVFVENVDEVLRQAFSLADTPHLERESQKKSPVRPRKGRLKISRHRAAHQ
jgi:ATP-dependent Lon protease